MNHALAHDHDSVILTTYASPAGQTGMPVRPAGISIMHAPYMQR